MQDKIRMIVSDFHPTRLTKEMIYDAILEKYDNIKMTTFLTEFYRLVREGVINKGDDNLYGLGAYRTKKIDWLPDVQD